MIAALISRIVEFARRHAALVVLAIIALSTAAGVFALGHLSINTDVQAMLPADLPWRRNEIALDQAFPQNADLIVAVIDGRTADLADSAARRLADKMRAEPDLFTSVRQPDSGPFFERNGLLFLPVPDLDGLSRQLIAAQPLLGSLARDPSLRGLFGALSLFVANAAPDEVNQLDPTLDTIARAVRSVLDGKPEPMSWQQLMTGQPPDRRELRRFILTKPVRDFASLEPGGKATAEIRRLGRELGITEQSGVRLRLTGPVPLDDEQFATLSEGATRSTILSIVSVCAILFAALRSVKLVGAILATLAAGFAVTAGFAALAIGSLNLISIAFGVLFIGLAVDFSIQFSVRYRDQRHRFGTLPEALRGTALTLGPALTLAAGATAIGFLSFVPTRYTGIRELGWIAGAGMIIAVVLNFLLLPALLTLLRPRGEPESVGFARAAVIDRWLIERRRAVIAVAVLLAAGSLALMPRLSFDFDPLDLKNPKTESVATALDLIKDPTTSPYAAEVIAPSLPAAQAVAERLSKLPEVAEVLSAATFIPADQDQKLAILQDLALLLGPTLNVTSPLPPPADAEIMTAITACRDALQKAAAARGPDTPPAKLAAGLSEILARGPGIIPPLRDALLSGLLQRLHALAELLQAQPVTLASLPPELRDDWIASDGRARVEVFPKGDVRDHRVLQRFVAAVSQVAPNATGSPVTIQEAGDLISSAFLQAGLIAVVAITVLLAAVLRRIREVALVIAPLLLAAALTLAITVVIGTPLNYANIIALPLLLGIGVAFDIYFVMNWRAGESHHLQSSTARAVVFSALTTMSAFGSLALSNDPGTAGMGQLLSISLAATLFCTLFILPALLGPAPAAPDRHS